LTSTLPPRPPRPYLDRDVKVEESSFKFVTEDQRSDMKGARQGVKDYGTMAHLCHERELLGAAA